MSRPLQELKRFFQELRRRNVYRVAATYAVVAFVGFQAAKLLIPTTVLPAWTDEFFLFLLIIGFPVAVVVAWAFELTPEGVRRTADAAGEHSGPDPQAGSDREGEPSSVSSATVLVGAVAILLLTAGGWWYLRPDTAAQAEAASEQSIAVLPFDDLSPAGSSEHLGLGLTESIIAELALIEDLSVVSRTSVMQYRNPTQPIPAIADSLGVEHILEGSIRQHGDSVQITAQLIRADEDRHIWTKTYDRAFSDIFRVQSEVARQVADALEAELTADTRERLAKEPTDDPAAYKLYLRGRDLAFTEERTNVQVAIELFKQAIELDSTFALAYRGLSRAYEERGDLTASEAWTDSAESAARRALELDPDLAEGHLALAIVLFEDRGHLDEAERHLKRALALKPSDGEAYATLALLYHWGGQMAESLRWAWRALSLVPDDPSPRVHVMQAMFVFREEAAVRAWKDRVRAMGGLNPWLELFHPFARGNVDTLRRRVEIQKERDPDAGSTLKWQGILAQLDGEPQKAREHYLRAREAPGTGASIRLAQTILATGGDSVRAEELLNQVIQRSRSAVDGGNEAFMPPLHLARAYAVLGEEDEAYRWLDSIPVTVNLREVPHDPVFRSLHGEERFEEWRQRAHRRAMKQRSEAMKWAREEGIDWPPMPEDSPAEGG